MTDEVYEFIQDCKDKKITARSARNKRTHNGKAGKVRLPSDYLTKKEREAMNGECKSYRMNDPISWKEFKSWPEEHQITYIKLLRQKYNAPDKAIATMMGVSGPHLCRYIGELGIATGRGSSAAKKNGSWDEDGFYAWCGMVKVDEKEPCEHVPSVDICDGVGGALADVAEASKEVAKVFDDLSITLHENSTIIEDDTQPICDNPYHNMPVIPARGNMSFCDNDAEDVLQTLKCILSGVRVNMHVSWEVVKE